MNETPKRQICHVTFLLHRGTLMFHTCGTFRGTFFLLYYITNTPWNILMFYNRGTSWNICKVWYNHLVNIIFFV